MEESNIDLDKIHTTLEWVSLVRIFFRSFKQLKIVLIL